MALILPKHNVSVEGLKEHLKQVGIRPVLKHEKEIYVPQLEGKNVDSILENDNSMGLPCQKKIQ